MFPQAQGQTVQVTTSVPSGVPAGTTPSVSFVVNGNDSNINTPGQLPTSFGASGVVGTPGSTTVIGSPGTATVRTVNVATFTNLDTANSVTISLALATQFTGSTLPLKSSVTLGPGETLQYGSTIGYQVYDVFGQLKTNAGGGSGISGTTAAGLAVESNAMLLMLCRLFTRMNRGEMVGTEEDMISELTDPDFMNTVTDIEEAAEVA